MRLNPFYKFSFFCFLFFPCVSSFGQTIGSVVGTGSGGFGGDGGPASSAIINNPYGVRYDSNGNLYIADYANNRIRKISTSGIITTIAGSAAGGFSGDGGPATTAALSGPRSIAFDAAGNLYIADQQNHRIRMVNSAGDISTFAGNGSSVFAGDGGPAALASLNGPCDIYFDAIGNLYIADRYNNRIRMVNTSGIISTIAGNGSATYAGDGGQATAAALNNPTGVFADASGRLYIADLGNDRVRVINTTGVISTVAGNGMSGFSGDGGPATSAKLLGPEMVAVSSTGILYIADRNNHRIRKVTTSGTITTLAGNGTGTFSGDGGPSAAASLQNPVGLAINSSGDVVIGDCNNNRVRNVMVNVTNSSCPTPVSVIARDSATSALISNGTTISCMAKPFYIYANVSGTTIDTVNGIFFPTIETRMIYQNNLGTYGTIRQYEGGTYVGCYIGNTGNYPIGAPMGTGSVSATAGQWWWTWNTCMTGGLDPTKQHDFVFQNTNTTPIPNTTVVVKYTRSSTTFSTTTWNLSAPGSFTISIPANSNIGTSSYNINPAPSNTLALQNLRDGRCKIDPRLLSLGTYTVTYIFSDTLCPAGVSTNFVFTVGQPIVNWTAPKSCLPGSCVTLSVTSGSQTGGTWSGTGVSGSSFCSSLSGLGNFNVLYTVGSGTCTNSQSHTVTVNPTPTITVNSFSTCPGGSATLSASGATTYTWSPAVGLSGTFGANVVASPSLSTNYTVSGTSNFCNSSTVSQFIIFPKPVSNYSTNATSVFISNPTVYFTDQTTGAAVNVWNWSFGDGAGSTIQNPSYSYPTIGTFNSKLVVTSTNGCKDSSSKTIIVTADDITIYNSFTPNGDGLNDAFIIDNIDQFTPNHIYIYNRWGQLMWDKADYDNRNVVWEGKDNNGNSLMPGTYYYIIEVNGKNSRKNWLEIIK